VIHRLYVIVESGSAVFEKIWLQKKSTDTQIFSGFLTALTSFAIEALGSGGLQSIQLMNSEKLAIFRHEQDFVVVVMADDRDNDKLLNSLMEKIADSFYEQFKNDLNKANMLDIARNFGGTIDEIMKNKTSNRNMRKVIYGTFLSLALLITLFLLSVSRLLNYDALFQLNPIDFNTVGPYMAAISIFLSTLFFIPSLLAGYISGNKKWGMISASSLMIISFTLLLFTNILRPLGANPVEFDLIPWLITFSPAIFAITILLGYIGAWIKERTRLYQLEPDRVKLIK